MDISFQGWVMQGIGYLEQNSVKLRFHHPDLGARQGGRMEVSVKGKRNS